MERKRILKQLYGEPPKFDPRMVEELLRDVEISSGVLESNNFDVSHYRFIDPPKKIFEKPYFGAYRSDNTVVLLDSNGRELMDLDHIYNIEQVGNEVYIAARKGSDNFALTSKGKIKEPWNKNVLAVFNGFGKPYFLFQEGEMPNMKFRLEGPNHEVLFDEEGPIFVLTEGDDLYFMVLEIDQNKTGNSHLFDVDGNEILPDLFGTKFVDTIENQRVFILDYHDRVRIVDEDGQRITNTYKELKNIESVGGETYLAVTKFSTEMTQDTQRNVLFPEWGHRDGMWVLGDKVFVRAKKDDEKYKLRQVMVGEDGKQIGEDFDTVEEPYEVNGTVYFVAGVNGRKKLIDENGKTISQKDESIHKFFPHLRMPVYSAWVQGKIHLVTEKGREELGETFDTIDNVYKHNGDYWVVGSDREGDWFIKPPGSEDLLGPFEEIDRVWSIGDEIYFEIGDSLKTLVNSKGKEVIKPTVELNNVLNVNGEPVIVKNEQLIKLHDEPLTEPHIRVLEATTHNGDLYYCSHNTVYGPKNSSINGKEFGLVHQFVHHNDELWVRVNNNLGEVWLESMDGERIEVNFSFDRVVSVGGELFFKVWEIDAQGKRVAFWAREDGTPIGGKFPSLMEILEQGGRRFFYALIENEKVAVDMDDGIIYQTDNLKNVRVQNGEYLVETFHGEKPAVVAIDGEELDIGLKDLHSIIQVGDELYVVGQIEEGWFILDSDGEPLDHPPFDKVHGAKKVDEEKIFIVGERNQRLYQEYISVK